MAELAEPATPFRHHEPYGVPRRFGVGTMLIVTTAYGMLLAVLRLAGWPPGATAWILAFISLVGLGQMLLFGAKRPREASVVTGAIGLPLAMFAFAMSFGFDDPHTWLAGLVCAVPFGAAAGYLAGGVVAGVFLVMDAVEQKLAILFPRSAERNK
ncbi:MAG TPA: hypothetical protein VFW87_14005 [Pirellulales bacterium]|nr:hypothetical protein [Pirellulales bacterium]